MEKKCQRCGASSFHRPQSSEMATCLNGHTLENPEDSIDLPSRKLALAFQFFSQRIRLLWKESGLTISDVVRDTGIYKSVANKALTRPESIKNIEILETLHAYLESSGKKN